MSGAKFWVGSEFLGSGAKFHVGSKISEISGQERNFGSGPNFWVWERNFVSGANVHVGSKILRRERNFMSGAKFLGLGAKFHVGDEV